MEDLEIGALEYIIIGEFLMDLKEFGRRDNKTMKVAKLKKIEQESKMIEKFMQKFRRVARKSEYKKRPLEEDFKRGMNKVIWRKLIEAE